MYSIWSENPTDVDAREERVSELEDQSIGIIQVKNKMKNITWNKEQTFTDLWGNIKSSLINI